MMNLRQTVLLSVVASGIGLSSLSVRAQQSTVPVLGFLTTASEATRRNDQLVAFHAGLAEAGFAEGQNLKIEYRWANDDYTRLHELAADLVALRVAVIVAAGGHVSALVARDVTKEIPIVFTTVTDPVKEGLVASLNKPGGNATGTAGLTSELDPKRLEFLHTMIPSATLFGVLINPNRPGLAGQLTELQAAADKLDLKLEIQEATSDQEIKNAFQVFASPRVGAVIVTADPLFNNHRALVLSLAASNSFPAIYQWREFATDGGLMSYGPSITEAYHHAGVDAGLILKGAKPADIPVVQPVRFQLFINLKTAKSLHLDVPQSLLAIADKVIE
jgi:ABC-type uncharacterized transport system substrate-binding protein